MKVLTLSGIMMFLLLVLRVAGETDCVSVEGVPPLDPKVAFIRQGIGEFDAPRKGGTAKHQGVDLVFNRSHTTNDAYAVRAWRAGTVAYAALNRGSCSDANGNSIDCGEDTGYGNVVILDHNVGQYSLYAHLSFNKPFTSGQNLHLKVGDSVCAGDVIGYTSKYGWDIWFEPTGNATRLKSRAAHNQLHFASFRAPAGRKGTSIRGITGEKPNWVDMTRILENMGFKFLQVD
jgi:murein DD-endopeptidase MepM/ murein hydrolase activator NlpD